MPYPEALLGRRIDGQQGWGLSLGTLLRQLSPNAVGALPLPDKLLADQVGALLCLALQPESVAQQSVKPARDLAAGIGDAIRARCTDPSHFTRVYKRVTGQTPKQTRTGS